MHRIRNLFVRQLLDPVPGLEFYPDPHHRYRYKGEWLPYTVTQVLDHDLKPIVREFFEKTKHGPDGWKVRGDFVHKNWADYLKGKDLVYDEKWAPWIDTLLAEPLLQDITPLAVEQPLLNTIKRVGGTPDAIFVKGDDIYIADLKTVGKKERVSSRKPALAQLGAYLEFAASCYHGVYVTKLVTIIAGPGKCKVRFSELQQATDAWQDAWGRFSVLQPDF